MGSAFVVRFSANPSATRVGKAEPESAAVPLVATESRVLRIADRNVRFRNVGRGKAIFGGSVGFASHRSSLHAGSEIDQQAGGADGRGDFVGLIRDGMARPDPSAFRIYLSRALDTVLHHCGEPGVARRVVISVVRSCSELNKRKKSALSADKRTRKSSLIGMTFKANILIVALLITGAFSSSESSARYVTYSLKPAEAENVLAGLSERPRLLDEKWMEILGERNGQTYTVKRGENLWDISRKLFGSGYYWSKLWETNPALYNPHTLEKGYQLQLTATIDRNPASTGQLPNEIRIPLTKLVPDSRGGGTDLDSDGVVNLDIKNRFRPRFRVLSPDDEVLGEISGSYHDGEGLVVDRDVFVRATARTLERGEKFAIIHEEKLVRDRTAGDSPFIGNLVQIVGELEIVEVGEKLLKARITSGYGIISRGDKLIPAQAVVNWSMNFNPPDELQCRILMGEEPVARLFVQGQLVLLNKGSVDGMKEGYLFRVWSDSDPTTERDNDVEPVSKGEIQVIHVGTLSSVGFVVRNSEPLQVGDTLIPRQSFANPSRQKFVRFGGSLEIQ